MIEVILKCRFGDHLPDPRKPVTLSVEDAEYLISEGLATLPTDDSIGSSAELGELKAELEELRKGKVGELKASVKELEAQVKALTEQNQALTDQVALFTAGGE